MQEFNYNMSSVEKSTRSAFNATALKNNNNNQTENIKMFSNINLNTPINLNNNVNSSLNNPNLKAFDSSKTFSTKNANGKRFVFNEKQDKPDNLNVNMIHDNSNIISQQYQQLINQPGNNMNNNINKNLNMNANRNLVEKPNNLNRFTKIGKENTSIVQKSNDKIKNLFSNKFA